jgi:FtsH-binding integral membrane protein
MISRQNSIFKQTSLRSSSQQMAISGFVSRTYGWMFLGLLLTGFVSFSIASSQSALELILGNRAIFYGALIAEVVLVMGMTAAFNRLSAATATLGFLAYSALNGVTLSTIFLAYTMTSIGQVFFISAGMFGGLALFGTVTKKDLTGIGSFVGMGVWGLILVGLVNMFVQSEALSLGMAAAGVIIFSGLTAYEAQNIRSLAYQYASNGASRDSAGKGAIFGALSLYLNFINLFLSLLRLFGNRRN